MLAIAVLLAATLWGYEAEGSVLVADRTMSRMVELNAYKPFCTLYTDRGIIQKMILETDPKKVQQISAHLVKELEETCRASEEKGKVLPSASAALRNLRGGGHSPATCFHESRVPCTRTALEL